LKIRNMIRNRHLARSIQDASWGEFIEMLSYKAEGAGKIVKKVNQRGTSEGLSMDDPYRDYISANRILMRGRDYPDTPVERRPILKTISYKDVVLGHVFSMKQEAPSVRVG
jgi:putative transposase